MSTDTNNTPQNPFAAVADTIAQDAPSTTAQSGDTAESTTVDNTEKAKKERHFGPIIGIVIIVALIAFGGLYYWGAYLRNAAHNAPQAQTSDTASAPADAQYDNAGGGTSFEVLDSVTDDDATVIEMTDDEFEAFLNGEGDTALDMDMDAIGSLDSELDDLEATGTAQ